MSPTGGETGRSNAELSADFVTWNRRTQLGVVFDSSTCFKLPGGGDRSPDVAWVEKTDGRLSPRPAPQVPAHLSRFRPRTPFPSDNVTTVRAKMQEYLDSGLRLGRLINPQDQQVEIYRSKQVPEILQAPESLSGSPVIPDFILNLSWLWQQPST